MSKIQYQDRRLAFHEAGHALVAFKEGFEPISIVLSAKRWGRAAISPRLPGRSAELYALSRIRVLVAGAVAECLALHPEEPKCTLEAFGERGNARSDWIKAEELARLVVHLRDVGGHDDIARAAATDTLLGHEIQAAAAIIEASRKSLNRLAMRSMQLLKDLAEQDPDSDDWRPEAEIGRDELLNLLVE